MPQKEEPKMTLIRADGWAHLDRTYACLSASSAV